MIEFKFLDKKDAGRVLPALFEILYANMSVIAPSGQSKDDDYAEWIGAVAPALEKAPRQIILICDGAAVVGYFQYFVNGTTFMMEEMQLTKEYQGTGIFSRLLGTMRGVVPEDTPYIEAYAHKLNERSQNVLKHFGLEIIGENNSGNSWHFRGDCRAVLAEYAK